MSNQAAHSDASTTTSEFFAGSYDSSASSSEESGEKGSPRDIRPVGLLVPRGLSPVLKEVNVAVYPWIWSHRQLAAVAMDTISPTLRGSGVASLDHIAGPRRTSLWMPDQDDQPTTQAVNQHRWIITHFKTMERPE
ncbi:hypothetical protein C8F01DRAFT_1232559 [Mycena amicta]|nr:hypothetical protein C8F01DRAFT_1232559 [Mycena amicta]